MNLDKYLARLGYGSRKGARGLIADGRVTDADGSVLYEDDAYEHASVRVDGEPLDPPPGALIMLHKPVGYTCSTKDSGRLVHDLLPLRFRSRTPAMSMVGRLDRDTSGLLLLTDDGQLLHRIISPRSTVSKVYIAELAEDLRGDEVELFGAGTLMLDGETHALLPVEAEVLASRRMRLTLHEGRYHQVRRMFAACGNHVNALHRERVGMLDLGALESGRWCVLDPAQRERVFSKSDPAAASSSAI